MVLNGKPVLLKSGSLFKIKGLSIYLHVCFAVPKITVFLAPNPKGLGAYNLGSVCLYVCTFVRTSIRPYVRTSVDSDFSEVYGSNNLKLYTKIRYGLRIMHVK